MLLILTGITILVQSACQGDMPEKKKQEVPKVRQRFTALPETTSNPPDNPSSPAKVELGRLLFYDPILSGNRDVACATCHHPSSGYAETLQISVGVNGEGFGQKRNFKSPNDIPFTKRNSQSILNTAFNGIDILGKYDPANAPMFWDLRVQSLEKQCLEPIKALEEMRGRHYSESEILPEIIRRLRENPEYVQLFSQAFPETDPVNITNMAKSIAAFERTLLANNSRFDRYMRGDKTALSESELEGFEAFKEAGCGNCHNGPMFSDFKTHVLGVTPSRKLMEQDSGFTSTFAFRTPSLRNLRFTFPFMHNGEIETLKEVLEFYEDIGGGKSRNPAVPREHLDPLTRELKVEVKKMGQIINFLLALNDDHFDKKIPESVPSGLPVAGNIQ